MRYRSPGLIFKFGRPPWGVSAYRGNTQNDLWIHAFGLYFCFVFVKMLTPVWTLRVFRPRFRVIAGRIPGWWGRPKTL